MMHDARAIFAALSGYARARHIYRRRVRPSHAVNASKLISVGSYTLHHRMTQGLRPTCVSGLTATPNPKPNWPVNVRVAGKSRYRKTPRKHASVLLLIAAIG